MNEANVHESHASDHSQDPAASGSSGVNGAISCYFSLCEDQNLLLVSGCLYKISFLFIKIMKGCEVS